MTESEEHQEKELAFAPMEPFYIAGIEGTWATVLSWFRVTVAGNVSLDRASSMCSSFLVLFL